MNKNYNGGLDFWKLIFTLVIVIFHAGEAVEGYVLFPHGALAVEFFFIISGYLMATGVSKKTALKPGLLGSDTANFILHKIKGILPYYLFAYIVSFSVYFFYYFQEKRTFLDVVEKVFSTLPNFFLLSTSGINQTSIMGTTWYISAMLISMTIIYPILRKHTDFYLKIIAPLSSILVLGYLMQKYGGLQLSYKLDILVLKEILRAILGLNIGCFVFVSSQKLYNLTRLSQMLLTIVEFTCYIGILYSMSLLTSNYVFVILFLFFIALTITASKQGIHAKFFDNKYINATNRYSLAIYLCQSPCRKVITELEIDLNVFEFSLILLISSTLLSFICILIVNNILYIYQNRKNNIVKLFVNS